MEMIVPASYRASKHKDLFRASHERDSILIYTFLEGINLSVSVEDSSSPQSFESVTTVLSLPYSHFKTVADLCQSAQAPAYSKWLWQTQT